MRKIKISGDSIALIVTMVILSAVEKSIIPFFLGAIVCLLDGILEELEATNRKLRGDE